MSPQGGGILDIGAGGGLFLHLAKQAGFDVVGSEPKPTRVQFAKDEYGLALESTTIDDVFWDTQLGSYEAVSLWDVIEHVNSPKSLLERSRDLLKPGGILLMDTPARDSLFYRAGELAYKISGGKRPFLLKTMYSPMPFAHKQIFRLQEVKNLLQQLGFEVIFHNRFHELSFPRQFYLRRILRNKLAVKLADPIAGLILAALPVANKMLVIARKSG